MLLNKPISILYFINTIKWQLALIILFAFSVGLLHLRPELVKISIPLGVLTLVGTSVSLLLAFRTAQSYERWWEARIVWGAIVNDSRTLIRDLIQFMSVNEADEIKLFAERQIIWTYTLGESLRRMPFSPKVKAYIRVYNIEASNIPNALLQEHSAQIKALVSEGFISEFRQVQLSDTVGKLCDSMGKCERIKNTVFPRSYSVLLHTLIYVFTAILPFGLDRLPVVIDIGICILIPAMFISIEKTAIIMQDPFENTPVDTPMTTLAQTIEINIRQAIGDTDIPGKEANELYYEM